MKFEVRHRIARMIAMLLFGAMAPGPLRAEEHIAALEKRIAALEADRQEHMRQRAKLILRSDRLAGTIEELKGEARTKDVKAALRTSQDLTRRIEQLDGALAALDAKLGEERANLKAAYEERITALIRQLVDAPDSAREALLEELIRYRTAKRGLDAQERERKAKGTEDMDIEIEPQDGPDEIREKADVLADAADRFSTELSSLTARIEELKREKRIRRKMQELADEIFFFDEDLAEGRAAQQPQPTFAAPPASDMERVGGPIAPPVAASGETAYRTGPETFSLEDLDRDIQRLIRRSKELSKKTTVLRDKAQRFYRKAKELTEAPADAPSR